ncbi:peptidoglycan DD-metalloendopeptidase family protein [Micromonospora sp. URMC 103]|uniref:peptidoglycan DD-metalloendopeptidase family protein n=1 Tax=Micromonospora sp. URMC 103 TaxID=3423406 RepID=UPI003F1AC8AE
MRTRRSLRQLGAVLAAAVLTATAAVVATTAPAAAACDYIPPNHDPNVIRIVHQVGVARAVSDRVLLAGFEAGWVESHMNNLPCGDKDSLGVFQQRPSQGWGTPEQILDVTYASTQFFSRAQVEDGRCPACTAGQIAQRVQRSAFPDRYDQSEPKARALLAEARASAGGAVAGRAFSFGDQQHVTMVNTGGTLTNFSWSPSTGIVRPDWGGGPLTGKTVGYVHDGLQHVFARGTDNTLRHWYQSGTNPPGLDSWNTTGRVMSDPTGFAYGNQQHVFFRNPEGNLEHRFYDTVNGQVSGGVWPGGTFVGNPHAFVHRDQQHIFGRTAAGALIHWFWWPGINPSVDNWGITSGVASDPTGFSYAGNQHHVFWRNTDGNLAHRFFDDPSGTLNGGVWAGGTFVGNPHAFVHGDQQHIVGRRANGDLIHWYWWPGTNPANDTWNALGVVAGDPIGLSTPGQHHIFYRTTNGTLEHRFHNDATGQLGLDNWGGALAG